MRISRFLKKAEKNMRKIPAYLRKLKAKWSSLKSESPSFNKLIRSSVALALMVVMLITLTFSWLGDNFSSNINSNDFITIDADAGLQMNYGDDNQPDGSIDINNVLKNGFVLQECSSTDGRTIFFPTYNYSSSDKEFVEDVETGDLLFREATANDKNTKYISVDFSLSAQSDTDIWLSSASKIYCTDENNTAANAIRVAFIDKSVGGTSTVFDNSFAEGYTKEHSPVSSISTSGVASVTQTQPHALSEYMYGNKSENKLFHIKKGETLNASMVIWLEGTDADCHSPVLNTNDIQIYIGLVTSYQEMTPITFIDKTLEKWVKDAECYVFILDDDNVPHLMTKSANYDTDYTWTGYLPSGVTNVRFARYNPLSQSNNPEQWNNWDAGALGECTTYNAIGHGAGIWADNLTTQVITVFDGTPEQKFLNARSNHLMHIKYSVTDGNENTANLDYKMSYQYVVKEDNSHIDYKKWCMVIPAEASDITFKWCDSPSNVDNYNPNDLTTVNTWSNTTRNDNLYFTITKNGSDFSGYWSNELIYVKDDKNFKGDDAILAAYFYNRDSNLAMWTSMQAKSSEEYYVAAVPPNLQDDAYPDTASVYFTNRDSWGAPAVHYWGGTTSSSTWPGITMAYSHQNEYNQKVYKAEVPKDAKNIIFSDNGSKQYPNCENQTLSDGIGYYFDSDSNTVKSYTLEKRYGVVITRYPTNMSTWSFDNVHNKIEPSNEYFGTKHLFTITGWTGDNNEYINGSWE